MSPTSGIVYLPKRNKVVTKVAKGSILRLHKSDASNQSLYSNMVATTMTKVCDKSSGPMVLDQERSVIYIGTDKGVDVVDLDQFVVVASFECGIMVTSMCMTPDKNKLIVQTFDRVGGNEFTLHSFSLNCQ